MLEIRDLHARPSQGEDRLTVALRGVDLEVAPGESVGVVGETGCGKTVTGLAAMRLLPRTARLTAGPSASRATTCWRSTSAACAACAGTPSR